MKAKRAEQIEFFLCDTCASVHVGLFRNGEMYAEAIPIDQEAMLDELRKVVAESRVRQGLAVRKH